MTPGPLITFRRPPATLNRSLLERFAETLRTRVAKGMDFHCLITGDAELRALNQRFRRKDYATDVLSFPSGERTPIGDIAVSLGRARAQAKEWGHTLEDEVRVLMLHGVLHLTGLDHETDAGEMEKTESRWRKKLDLPSGLTERARA